VLAQACALGAGRPETRACPGRDHNVTPCKSSCSGGSQMRSLQTRCEDARGRLKRRWLEAWAASTGTGGSSRGEPAKLAAQTATRPRTGDACMHMLRCHGEQLQGCCRRRARPERHTRHTRLLVLVSPRAIWDEHDLFTKSKRSNYVRTRSRHPAGSWWTSAGQQSLQQRSILFPGRRVWVSTRMGSALGCVRSRDDVEDNKKPGKGRLLQQKTSQGAKVVRAGWAWSHANALGS